MNTVTKEASRFIKVAILGLAMIIILIATKYKFMYKVTIDGEHLGYIENIKNFNEKIQEEILDKKEGNIDNISLSSKVDYKIGMTLRTNNVNEDEIIEKLAQNYTKTTYKFYAVALNQKTETYVNSEEEAEEVVNKIKSEYDGNGLDLDLSISEVYSENKEAIDIKDIEIAKNDISEDVEVLIDEKEAREALAHVNGINLSVLPVTGMISSRFSDVSRTRSYRPHSGLDIACANGTDIKATSKGKVVFAGWDNTGLGNAVKIDHGNGVQTWYGHCSKLYVSVGDEIHAGDVIAAVGSTGNSTGPHLHFEIRIDGVAVNPQTYIYK